MRKIENKYITILIVFAFVIQSVIYWFDLNPNIKYIQYVLTLLLLHNIYQNEGINGNIMEWKLIKKYLVLIIFLALLAENISILTLQAFINQVFIFIPILIFANIEMNDVMLSKISKVIASLFIINLIITFFQSLVLHYGVDYVSGTFGRSATPSLGIFCSIIYSFTLGAFVFLKKRKYFFIFILPILALLIIAEIKAGFLFILLNSLSLLLFPKSGKKINIKAIIVTIIIFSVISWIVIYIFPVYYGNEYMTQVLTDKDSVLEYYGTQNYYDGRLTRLDAFYKVFVDFFQNPVNLFVGYGIGATSTSSLFNVGMFNTSFGQLMYYYSMVSEVILYLINYGIIGTVIFVFINIAFIIISLKASKRTTNSNEKNICFLSFTTQTVMLISFLIYARPFMSYYLTLMSFGLVGMVARIRKRQMSMAK